MNRKNIIYIILKKCEKPGKSVFWNIAQFFFAHFMVFLGDILIYQLKKQYKERNIMFIPSVDAGDVLFLRYSYKYLVELYGKDAILIIFEKNIKFAKMLGMNNVLGVKQTTLLPLAYAHYARKKEGIINVYNWCMFDFDKISGNYKVDFPCYDYQQERIDQLFKENKMIKGKTVVFAPYEQGITASGYSIVPSLFWEQLADYFKQKGFTVCTNCPGTENEPVIRGTQQVFPKMEDMKKFLEDAGYFISIRSGLCDYVRGMQCKNIILYPNIQYLDQWSMKKFDDSDNCVEIIYSENLQDSWFGIVIDKISKWKLVR